MKIYGNPTVLNYLPIKNNFLTLLLHNLPLTLLTNLLYNYAPESLILIAAYAASLINNTLIINALH